ncbi:MAG: hypothetical protein JNJ77_08390 [Planctomycetia bacterium]|nr:hypothetical protein [Planctomycetia bacterium]
MHATNSGVAYTPAPLVQFALGFLDGFDELGRDGSDGEDSVHGFCVLGNIQLRTLAGSNPITIWEKN